MLIRKYVQKIFTQQKKEDKERGSKFFQGILNWFRVYIERYIINKKF